MTSKHPRDAGQVGNKPKRQRGISHGLSSLRALSAEDEKLLKSIDSGILQAVTLAESSREQEIASGVHEHRDLRMRTSRLPSLAQTIRSLMVSSKGRSVTPLAVLLSQIRYATAMPQGQVEDSVRMLASLLPEWCKIFELEETKICERGETEYFSLVKTDLLFVDITKLLKERIEKQQIVL